MQTPEPQANTVFYLILDEEQQQDRRKRQTGSWKKERGEWLSTSCYGEQMWGNSLTTP
ncbi:unnamed protein product [Tetraodon nigroviridis]|uniref:(spotted green pufferfish) hypothetical protein n=1 Tax=Tetraodon nigroviridis TaxID=99883 RepID=Q4SKQ8_TETNG|nr:unnamed protein product [Tetraodon nigroviridis]